MLDIKKTTEDDTLIYYLTGRLDTTTSPELEDELVNLSDDVKKLVFDFEKLEYISSAGLRILLSAQKKMSQQGEMKVINVDKTIMEIFEVTGFTDFLDIE